MEAKKKKNRPVSCKYPPDDVLEKHIKRGITAAEMARLFGICVPTMKSYLKQKGMRINQEDRHFRCDASKILRCGELMKMGYSEKESITMSMLKIGSGVISEIQVRNEPRTTRKAHGLVELRVWLTPERRDEVVNFISRLDEYSFAIPVMTFKAITFRNKGDENEK